MSISKKIFFFIIIGISFSFQVKSYSNDGLRSLLMKANIFKKGETSLIKSNIIFQFEKWLIKENENRSLFVSYFKNKEGLVVAEERLLLKGKELIEYKLDQFQIDEHAKFFLKEGMFLEMRYRKGEERTVNKLKWRKNFILPPMILDYIRDNSSKILKRSQEVELVIPHLQTNISFTFKLKKKNDPNCFKEAFYCILFEPSNFFIGLFTEALYLSFDKKFRLIKASGPTLLYWRKRKRLSLVPFLGDSYFEYKYLNKKK